MPDLIDFLDSLPLAAAADPGTSHEAARRLKRSGRHAAQVAAVVAAVRANPGRTSLELAALAGMDRHAVSRRLADAEKVPLVRKGDARPCTASPKGLRMVTWWPTDQT